MQNYYAKNSILIFLPEKNFSEDEYLSVKNVFEKSGRTIFILSDKNNICSGENGLKVGVDVNLYNVNVRNFGAIVLIGGKGIKNYVESDAIHKIIYNFKDAGKVVGAICSAPVVLAKGGVLKNLSATCHFEHKDELISLGIDYKDTGVVNTNNIITADGPRSATQFAETVLNMIK